MYGTIKDVFKVPVTNEFVKGEDIIYRRVPYQFDYSNLIQKGEADILGFTLTGYVRVNDDIATQRGESILPRYHIRCKLVSLNRNNLIYTF